MRDSAKSQEPELATESNQSRNGSGTGLLLSALDRGALNDERLKR